MGSTVESSYFEDEVLLGLSLKSGTFRCLECKRSLINNISTLGMSCANCQKLLNLYNNPESASEPPSNLAPHRPRSPPIIYRPPPAPQLGEPTHPKMEVPRLPSSGPSPSSGGCGSELGTPAGAPYHGGIFSPQVLNLLGSHPSLAAALLLRQSQLSSNPAPFFPNGLLPSHFAHDSHQKSTPSDVDSLPTAASPKIRKLGPATAGKEILHFKVNKTLKFAFFLW